jgi:hypothetical protein
MNYPLASRDDGNGNAFSLLLASRPQKDPLWRFGIRSL